MIKDKIDNYLANKVKQEFLKKMKDKAKVYAKRGAVVGTFGAIGTAGGLGYLRYKKTKKDK